LDKIALYAEDVKNSFSLTKRMAMVKIHFINFFFFKEGVEKTPSLKTY
jgi:hypothetical protein